LALAYYPSFHNPTKEIPNRETERQSDRVKQRETETERQRDRVKQRETVRERENCGPHCASMRISIFVHLFIVVMNYDPLLIS
jgi:hypothetical protein